MRIQIKNGTVYDPGHGIDGEVMDLFVADGKLVPETEPELVIDAKGKTVMPGGIDVHSHIATYGLNLARFSFGLPTLNQIGEIYARMGYTHVNEPLMTLNTASYVHHELAGIPIIDTSALLVLTLYDIERWIRAGDTGMMNRLVLQLLGITRALNAMLYDVGIRYTKRGFFYRDISTHRCLDFFHRLSPLRADMPELQLRVYPELLNEDARLLCAFWLVNLASGIDDEERYEEALKVLKYGGNADLGISFFNPHLNIGYEPASNDFISIDIGLEKPLVFSRVEEAACARSLMFALEAVKYHEQISFSTTCGCMFNAYPRIFAALLGHTSMEELPHREYSMYELVTITRTNPARQLGLDHIKGHLGTGADADIAIYDTESKDLERQLGRCSYLLKGGEVVIKDGELVNRAVSKRTIFLPLKVELSEDLMELCSRRSFRAEHIKVDDCFLRHY